MIGLFKRGAVLVLFLVVLVSLIGVVSGALEVGKKYIADERIGTADCGDQEGETNDYEEVGTFVSLDRGGDPQTYRHCVLKKAFVAGEGDMYVSKSYFFDTNGGSKECPKGDNEHYKGHFFDAVGEWVNLCIYKRDGDDIQANSGYEEVKIDSLCEGDFKPGNPPEGAVSFRIKEFEEDTSFNYIMHCSSFVSHSGSGDPLGPAGQCEDTEDGERPGLGGYGFKYYEGVGKTFPEGGMLEPPEGYAGEEIRVMKDYCMPGHRYFEWYCDNEGSMVSDQGKCPGGCSQGYCQNLGVYDVIRGEFGGCFDGEGDMAANPEDGQFNRGYVDVFTTTNKEGSRYWDYCIDENKLIEYYCQSDRFDGDRSLEVSCAWGCEDGVCLEKPEGECELSNPKWKIIEEDEDGELTERNVAEPVYGKWEGHLDRMPGETVTLFVEATGNCEGKKIFFNITEDDFFVDDEEAQFQSTVATYEWEPIWKIWDEGDLDGDLEYYFIAYVEDDGRVYSVSERSDVLKVRKPLKKIVCEPDDEKHSVKGLLRENGNLILDEAFDECVGEGIMTYGCDEDGYIVWEEEDCGDGEFCKVVDGEGDYCEAEPNTANDCLELSWGRASGGDLDGVTVVGYDVVSNEDPSIGERVIMSARITDVDGCYEKIGHKAVDFELHEDFGPDPLVYFGSSSHAHEYFDSSGVSESFEFNVVWKAPGGRADQDEEGVNGVSYYFIATIEGESAGIPSDPLHVRKRACEEDEDCEEEGEYCMDDVGLCDERPVSGKMCCFDIGVWKDCSDKPCETDADCPMPHEACRVDDTEEKGNGILVDLVCMIPFVNLLC